MISLLKDLPPGYPLDYVIARVRGREAPLRLSIAASGPDSGRKMLQREYRWCFRQLERPKRAALAPVFFLAEMPCMAAAVRFSATGREDQARESLTDSLLAGPLVAVLCRQERLEEKIPRLSRQLAELCPSFRPIMKIPPHAPPALFERLLYAASGKAIFRNPLHPAVRRHLEERFQRQFLLAELKGRRWDLPEKDRAGIPAELPGSPPHLLRNVGARLRKLAGREAAYPANGLSAAFMDRIETALYVRMEEELSTNERQEQGMTVILLFLLRLSLAAMGIAKNATTEGLTARQD